MLKWISLASEEEEISRKEAKFGLSKIVKSKEEILELQYTNPGHPL